ncbi:MAG: ABC transporter substrate-binding protein [Armatimonadota bacterium]|nr:ABC transporter substrate-binding protein [Armatimonadota bacterium]MDR7534459.1 ABC transporter substrate-binding protein [Armatimonadota bacterium]MDR7535743.1 ABC transporter substrate-binding protein [Armatimonadota bacterium]
MIARRTWWWGSIAVLLGSLASSGMVAAAPSGAGSGTVAEVANYRGPDRQARLEAGARAEGALMIYTSMDLDESQPVLEAFMRKYPFIRGEIYRASGEDVAQKIITEYRGRKYVADLFEGTGIDVAKMLKDGYGQPFFTPRAGGFPRQAKDARGYWVATRYNMLVAAWNTTLVADATAPRRYEDLLDPRWRGRIGIEAEDQVWLATLLEHWGEARGLEFFRRLSEQQPLIRKGHTLLAELIVAGEVHMSPTIYNHRPERLKRRRAPIEWRPLEPVVAVPHVISLPKYAPHPHAALLFIDFFLSPEGQQELVKVGRIPAHPFVQANPPTLNQGFVYRAMDPGLFLERYARYDQLWQELFIRRR